MQIDNTGKTYRISEEIHAFLLSSYLAPPQLFRQLAKTDFAVFLLRYRYVESKKNKRQEDAVLIAGWEGVEAI